MTRYRHFASGVASAYGLLVANTVFSLASVPLALHYLSTEEFGLWAFVAQLLGMLQLIEMGVSGAFARVIIDKKDEKEGPEYARLSAAAWIILAIQATVILVFGTLIGHFLGGPLGISPQLLREFAFVLTFQCLVVACGHSIRIYSLLLFAHHRIAFSNICQIGSLAIMLGLQWLFFDLGMGIHALPAASGVGMVFVAVTGYFGCRRWNLFPRRWLRPSWTEFRVVLRFGHSIFLIHLAGQFILAGQVLVIMHVAGLEAAAIWTVCTRAFLLISQICWRPIDLAYTFFSEMIARGEVRHLWKRYSEVAGITIVTAVVGAVGFAFCNAGFVEIWTRGEISWAPINNVFLGAWLLPLSITRCGNALIQATKDLRGLKYVFMAEALVYLIGGFLALKYRGTAEMVAVFIAATSLLTALYTFRRTNHFFEISSRDALRVLLFPALPVAALSVLFGGIAASTTAGLGTTVRLLVTASAILAGSVLALRFALNRELKSAILRRVPSRLTGIASLAIGG